MTFQCSSLYEEIVGVLQSYAQPDRVSTLMKFFKTAKGEYGQGDHFMGVVVPDQRRVAKKYYKCVDVETLRLLLASYWHECRFVALVILVMRAERSKDLQERRQVLDIYLSCLEGVNNWDLVDISAPKIVGEYLFLSFPHNSQLLDKFVCSESLWQRRIALLAMFAFIKKGNFDLPLAVITKLLTDKHHLIHKAAGWMLREIGKIDESVTEEFLNTYVAVMPRIMLRYAIELFNPVKRRKYLRAC